MPDLAIGVGPAAACETISAPDRPFVIHRWPCAGAPVAVLVAAHGFGEHGAAYPYSVLAAECAAASVAVVSFDATGHGLRQEPRGRIDSWAGDFRADIRGAVRWARGAYPDQPLFLAGLSLGSIIVLDYLLHSEPGDPAVSGAITLGAPLGQVGLPPIKMAIARCLSNLWPGFAMNAGLDLENVSRDTDTATRYRADPLFHQRATARLGVEFPQTVEAVIRSAAQLRTPLLMLHGQEDRIALPNREFFDAARCEHKVFEMLPGARHNLLIESNRVEIARRVAAWITGGPTA